MKKDSRYEAIKFLIEGGQIRSFREILMHIPKTVVCEDLGMNFSRFTRCLKNTEQFTFEDAFNLSVIFDVAATTMISLVLQDCLHHKKAKNK